VIIAAVIILAYN